MNDAAHITAFIFAGRAVFTLTSKATGARFTYKVTTKDDATVSFVSVLTGPDTYTYAGSIFHDAKDRFRTTAKSRIGADAPSARAIAWYLRNIGSEAAEFHHEGKCGKCGRALTVPESIETGLGPVCADKLGL